MNRIKRTIKNRVLILFVSFLFIILAVLFSYNVLTKVMAEDKSWVQNDWRGDTYGSTVTALTGVTTFLETENIDYSTSNSLTMAVQDDWSLSEWLSRRKITFDNTLTNIGVEPENLVDFPVLIKLEDGVNIDYSNTNDDGSDIRFVDTDGTELSYEIDTWDESGDSYVWVKVPQIDIGDEDYIYLYYNNSSAEDDQDSADVWSSGYKAVYHNSDKTSGVVTDSTGSNNANKRSATEPNEVVGAINNAQSYDGSNDYSKTNNNFISNPSSLTIESWFRKTGEGSSYECVLHKGTATTIGGSDYWMGAETGNDYIVATIGATSASWSAGQTTTRATLGDWFHVVATWDGSVVKVYINGVYNKQYNLSSYGNQNAPTRMGASSDGSNYQFRGDIDEVMIADTSRSAAWIATAYKVGLDDLNTYEEEESKFSLTGFLVSNVFDTGFPSDWGNLSYTTSVSDAVTVKVRSSSSADMTGDIAWNTCPAITSGEDISETACMEDTERYVQYRVEFDMEGESTPPIFDSISINFSSSDQTEPEINASGVYLQNSVASGSWVNYEPTIIWDEGYDDSEGDGLAGYCISIEEVNISASPVGLDPAAENGAGILNDLNDGVDSDACEYIIDAEEIEMDEIDGLELQSNKKYYFSIKAVDLAGNVWSGSTEDYQNLIWFKYDDTPPNNVMYISTPSTDFGNINDMFFNWPITGSSQAVDNESEVLGWQYAINSSGTSSWKGTDTHAQLGVEYIPKEGIEEGLLNLSSDIDGEDVEIGNNTIYFRAIDNAGNVSTYVTGGINYGGAAPEFPEESVVTITPQQSTSNLFTISWPEASPQDADEIDSYYYMINTEPPSTLSTLRDNNNKYIPTDELSVQQSKLIGAVKGTNNVYVVAVDNEDNYSPTKAIHGVFYLNSTIPDAPQAVSAADLSIKGSKLWRVALSWEEPEYKGNGDLTYIIDRSEDNNTWEEVSRTSGLSYTDIVPTSKTYYYKVATIDTSNESVASPTYSTVVESYPQGRYEEAPELISNPILKNVTTRYAKINWVTDRISDSKVQIGLSSGEYFQDEMYRSDMVTEHEIELTNLSPGTQYYYRIKWTDQDGNTGVSKESVFQTKPAPIVEDIIIDSVGLNYAILKLSTSGATKARVIYGQTKSYGGSEEINTSTISSEYSIMLRELEDGTNYHYKIVLTDEEDFEYESFEDHVFSTPPRPQVSNIQVQEKKGVPTPTVEVFWESNIPINSIVRYSKEGKSLDKVDMELIEGEHVMEISALDPDSAYQLVVEGVDAMGNRATSESYAFTTATDTRPPLITNIKSEGDIQSNEIQTDRSRSAQLIISWETDEPSTSQVLYGEGAGGDGYPYSTQTDAEMRYKHLIVVSNLAPSKVYHFKVVSKDSAANVGESGSVTSITPKGSDSVIDSVLSSLSRIFNFL